MMEGKAMSPNSLIPLPEALPCSPFKLVEQIELDIGRLADVPGGEELAIQRRVNFRARDAMLVVGTQSTNLDDLEDPPEPAPMGRIHVRHLGGNGRSAFIIKLMTSEGRSLEEMFVPKLDNLGRSLRETGIYSRFFRLCSYPFKDLPELEEDKTLTVDDLQARLHHQASTSAAPKAQGQADEQKQPVSRSKTFATLQFEGPRPCSADEILEMIEEAKQMGAFEDTGETPLDAAGVMKMIEEAKAEVSDFQFDRVQSSAVTIKGGSSGEEGGALSTNAIEEIMAGKRAAPKPDLKAHAGQEAMSQDDIESLLQGGGDAATGETSAEALEAEEEKPSAEEPAAFPAKETSTSSDEPVQMSAEDVAAMLNVGGLAKPGDDSTTGEPLASTQEEEQPVSTQAEEEPKAEITASAEEEQPADQGSMSQDDISSMLAGLGGDEEEKS